MTAGRRARAIDRRAFLVHAGAAIVGTPRLSTAQPAGKTFRIGILSAGSPDVFRQMLREFGWVDGRNVALELRDPEGKPEQLDRLAAELVQLGVDVIIASTPAATFAARRSTTSIPIVMVNTPDPVQLGLVAALARPGGNITGTTTLSADLALKQLELLKEAIPRVVRVAVLWTRGNPWHPLALKGAEAAARSLAVQLQRVEVRDAEELEGAFAAMTRERAGAVLVLSDPMTFFHRARLAELAVTRRLPTMCGVRGYVDAGGLMSYWAHQGDLYRRVGSYVDRLLRGARAADLPIEQPTRFELVVNLKTGRTLGLTLPPSLVTRADTVIQ